MLELLCRTPGLPQRYSHLWVTVKINVLWGGSSRKLFHSSVTSFPKLWFLGFLIYKYVWLFFKWHYLFIFRERGREGEREKEKYQGVAASHAPPSTPTRDPARNWGMCPDWGLSQRHFGLQAGTQSTETHQPEQLFLLLLPDDGMFQEGGSMLLIHWNFMKLL